MLEMNVVYISQDEESLKNDLNNCFKLVPSEPIAFKYADLHHDDSGRSWIDGKMDVNIMRENVISFDLICNAIPYLKGQEILKNLKPKKDGGFYASVFHFETGERFIMQVYRGDRDITPHNYIGGDVIDLKVSLIQMN